MITGSHNAADENGLKMMKGKASFFADDIRRSIDRSVALYDAPQLFASVVEFDDVELIVPNVYRVDIAETEQVSRY